ncbi:MAG TPA: ribbon-helix-helix protein, CopG family [Actinomycetota bacterium]|jgi:metal-responsive CopG/Arc/MetJ family transcriptional regulator
MPRKAVLVQLSDELLERLDRLSREKGDSRSALVRDAVERYITQESQAVKDGRLREGYVRVPDPAPDAWVQDSLREMLDEESW